MASQTVTATLWVDDDLTATVGDNDDIGVVHLGRRWYDPIVTIHADAPIPNGPERRTAQLTVIRNLARRMLIACETAMADDRAKNAEGQFDRPTDEELYEDSAGGNQGPVVASLADAHPGLRAGD